MDDGLTSPLRLDCAVAVRAARDTLDDDGRRSGDAGFRWRFGGAFFTFFARWKLPYFGLHLK